MRGINKTPDGIPALQGSRLMPSGITPGVGSSVHHLPVPGRFHLQRRFAARILDFDRWRRHARDEVARQPLRSQTARQAGAPGTCDFAPLRDTGCAVTCRGRTAGLRADKCMDAGSDNACREIVVPGPYRIGPSRRGVAGHAGPDKTIRDESHEGGVAIRQPDAG